jgi:hypothetical protein
VFIVLPEFVRLVVDKPNGLNEADNTQAHSSFSRFPDHRLLAQQELDECMGGCEVKKKKVAKKVQKSYSMAILVKHRRQDRAQIPRILEDEESLVKKPLRPER